MEDSQIGKMVMEKCLGRLLENYEGMVIELNYGAHGKYLIWSEDGHIKIDVITEDDDEVLKDAKDGQLTWVHSGTMQ